MSHDITRDFFHADFTVRLFVNRISQVRAVKVSDKDIRALKAQFVYDIIPNSPGGCCRKCRKRNSREKCPKSLNPPVLRAELVTPHRNTMCFINCEKRDIAFLKHINKVRLHSPLGRHIENTDFSGNCCRLDRPLSIVSQRRVKHRNINPLRQKRIHLILHQCDKWRDDNSHPGKHQSRKLIAKRFAASGSHHCQNIMPGDNRLNNRLLIRAECLKMEESL